MNMFFHRNDGTIIHIPTGLMVPQTEWARRTHRVVMFFGAWLPSVLRIGGHMIMGAMILSVGIAVGYSLGDQRGFEEGCKAVTSILEPCLMVKEIQRLQRAKAPPKPLPEPSFYNMPGPHDVRALCNRLMTFPAPVGLSLARYAECPGLSR